MNSGTEKAKRDKKNVPNSRVASKRALKEKVIGFLEANAPLDFQPKFIANKIRMPYEAVKKCIQREMDNPKSNVVKVRPGWYRIAYTVDHMKSLKGEKRVGIHGLQLMSKCPSDSTRLFLYKNAPYRYKNAGTYSLSFRGRPVTIEVYQNTPTILVWLKASGNVLSLDEFDKFCYFVYGWAGANQIPESEWIVSQYGFNLDMYNLDMTKSGYKALTLSKFRKMWVQMYQKGKDMTRLEIHGTSQTLRETDLMRIISTFVSIAEGTEAERKPEEKYEPSKSDDSFMFG